MDRNKLQQQLSEHEPIDKVEEKHLSDMRLLLMNSDPVFDRTHFAPGHFTGSAWVLSPDGEQALLMHHRKLDLWLQVGGHADGNPDLSAVALREAVEETGIDTLQLVLEQTFDVDVHAIPARKDEPQHNHYDVRYLLQSPVWELSPNHESLDLDWFSPDEIMDMTDNQSIHRMVQKWLFILDNS